MRGNFSAKQVTRARILIADQVIAEGGSLSSFARKIGITTPGALFWLRRNDPERLATLVGGSSRSKHSAHEVLVRLLLIKSCEGIVGAKGRLAKALGINLPTLCEFQKRWAPDGLDAAIADLMPEDGAHG